MNFGCCSAYNHRTIEIGRDIWRLNPNPLLKRGSMRAGCLEPSWVLSLSKDGGCSPAFVGYLSPCLTTLTVFLKHQKSWSGIYFILFGAQWFWSFHWVPLRRVLLHFFTPPVTYLYTLVRCTHAHLEEPFWSQGQMVPASSSFSLYNRCSDGMSFTTIVLCFPGWNFECWTPVSMVWKPREIVNREITAISTFQSFCIG